MSTKCSIKWREQTEAAPGFHLFEDSFERLDLGDEAPVYLRVDGVPVHELSTTEGGASVTLELPREFAVALGLLPAVADTKTIDMFASQEGGGA